MPSWIVRRGSITPSSTARRNIVPWKYFEPKYWSQQSVWLSKWTSPTGPWRRAIARRIGREIEWSPPTLTGMTCASSSRPISFSTTSIVRSIEIGTTSMSP